MPKAHSLGVGDRSLADRLLWRSSAQPCRFAAPSENTFPFNESGENFLALLSPRGMKFSGLLSLLSPIPYCVQARGWGSWIHENSCVRRAKRVLGPGGWLPKKWDRQIQRQAPQFQVQPLQGEAVREAPHPLPSLEGRFRGRLQCVQRPKGTTSMT